MTVIAKKVLTIAAFGLLAASVFAGGKKDDGFTVVKMGVIGDRSEVLPPLNGNLEKDKIRVELVQFSEYVLVNQALEDGELDMNGFQHKAYLNNEIKTRNLHITAIAETILAPLGLYSRKIKSVSEFKNGDSIAIPSDATNGGRALKVIERAGLITVRPEAGYVPTLKDVTGNPLNLKFIEIEAAQTFRLMDDVTASIINGGHAVDSGLRPERDAIFLERQTEGDDNPYVNVLVVRTADKDNPVYKKVVEAYHTDNVKAIYGIRGAFVPVW